MPPEILLRTSERTTYKRSWTKARRTAQDASTARRMAEGTYYMKVHQRNFIKANGRRPWTCHFCGKPCTEDFGNGPEMTHLHHLDHNPKNNETSNLAVAHSICHHRYHKTGKKGSPQKSEKLSQIRKQMWEEGRYDHRAPKGS